jgi:sodium/bile acid cotransporter 7
MAGALFPAAQVGLLILPLMIFHQLQLFLCAALAARFARQAPARARLPDSEREIAAAAAALGLTIPDACMPGVTANLALLDRHAATLSGAIRP